MHEIGLAGMVLELVERSATSEGFGRVVCLRLEVGRLCGVEVESLRFALETIAPGTCLDGARIEIDERPGEAWCQACGKLTAINERGSACSHCGGYQLRPAGGTELRVTELLVEDD